MKLSNGERNLLVSGLNRLLAEPVDPMVNPQSTHDAARALRDRITHETGEHPHAAASLPKETLTRLQKRERTIAQGEHNGLEYKVSDAFNPDAPRWPNIESHLWGAFPYLAIEQDGYRDFNVQDPATGRTLWTFYPPEATEYDKLRHLVDVMEKTQFLGEPDQDPGPDGDISAPDGLGNKD